jgi:Beta-glucosidase-related glycosidases
MVYRRFAVAPCAFLVLVCALCANLVLCAGCKNGTKKYVAPLTPGELKKNQVESALENFINGMSAEQKISQLFLVSVDGTEAHLSATAKKIPPCGYILFSRNFTGQPEQIIALTGNVQSFYARQSEQNAQGCVPPLFAVDQEGGVVNRLSGIASALPSPAFVARKFSPDAAEKLYAYAAEQIASLGIHVNLAPVVETSGSHNGGFLASRSFGDTEKVLLYGGAFIRSCAAHGVFCVLKHFPGNTNDDPHSGLPILSGTQEQVNELYVQPFERMLNTVELSDFAFPRAGVLMSHTVVPAFDTENPSCLSYKTVSGILQNELHFGGLVLSDDLYMGALDKAGFSPVAASQAALRAGVHLLMLSRPVYWTFIPKLAACMEDDFAFAETVERALKTVLKAKLCMGLMELAVSGDGTAQLISAPLEKLYNPQKQLERFLDAKTEALKAGF